MTTVLATKRNCRVDFLKAVAMIAVVLYHAGNLKYGYLGVEVFLVIAGYFFMSSFEKKGEQVAQQH